MNPKNKMNKNNNNNNNNSEKYEHKLENNNINKIMNTN